MVKKVIRYHCGICDTAYPTRKEATACEALGQPDTRAQVGDRIGPWKDVVVEGIQVYLKTRPGGRYHEVKYQLNGRSEGRFACDGDYLRLIN